MKEDKDFPEIDESLLTPEQKAEMEKEKAFPWKWAIFTGVILLLMVVCVIVIMCLPSA